MFLAFFLSVGIKTTKQKKNRSDCTAQRPPMADPPLPPREPSGRNRKRNHKYINSSDDDISLPVAKPAVKPGPKKTKITYNIVENINDNDKGQSTDKGTTDNDDGAISSTTNVTKESAKEPSVIDLADSSDVEEIPAQPTEKEQLRKSLVYIGDRENSQYLG